MKIVGCDLHSRYQQIATLEEETGELNCNNDKDWFLSLYRF